MKQRRATHPGTAALLLALASSASPAGAHASPWRLRAGVEAAVTRELSQRTPSRGLDARGGGPGVLSVGAQARLLPELQVELAGWRDAFAAYPPSGRTALELWGGELLAAGCWALAPFELRAAAGYRLEQLPRVASGPAFVASAFARHALVAGGSVAFRRGAFFAETGLRLPLLSHTPVASGGTATGLFASGAAGAQLWRTADAAFAAALTARYLRDTLRAPNELQVYARWQLGLAVQVELGPEAGAAGWAPSDD